MIDVRILFPFNTIVMTKNSMNSMRRQNPIENSNRVELPLSTLKQASVAKTYLVAIPEDKFSRDVALIIQIQRTQYIFTKIIIIRVLTFI